MTDHSEANRLAHAALKSLAQVPTQPLTGVVEQLGRALVLVTAPDEPKRERRHVQEERVTVTVECAATPVLVHQVTVRISCMCAPGSSPHDALYLVAGRAACARSVEVALDRAFKEAR